ncbi:glycoside-pentoside-hexuronide (GPH):cation symporter [Enterobacter sp.]|uniref:MFS transporter n=1 Tax=Enterobacter sp. TaxID=42895 RepID=UPI00296FAA6C|nr:glycoside-pentoside-hexuronide (GPH):cation symporter [Enterobacter sp.]
MNKLTTTDRLSYAVGGGLASNLGFYVTLIFFITYATDIHGVDPMTVGFITLVSRLLDAFIDPIMGAIGDKTRTRFGKYRFWVIFSAPFAGLTTWAVFACPDISAVAKVVYMYAAYIIYSLVSTAANIPYHSLTAYLTDDVKERSNIVLIKQFTGLIAQFIVSAGGVWILQTCSERYDANGRAIIDSAGYHALGVTFGLLIMFGFWLCAWGARNNDTAERLLLENSEEDKLSVIAVFRQVVNAFQSRSLLSLAIMSAASTLVLAMSSGITVQFFTAVLNDPAMVKTAALINVVFGAVVYVIVKLCVTRYGNKHSFVIMCYLTIIPAVILWFTFNKEAVWYVMIMLGLVMCFTQGATLVTWMMVTDCADELYWRTNQNSAGIASSTLTFSNKFGSAIGAFVLGYSLNLIHYVPGASVQSAETISGLIFLMIIVPVTGKVIGLLSMLFYPLSKSRHQQILNEIHTRRFNESRHSDV